MFRCPHHLQLESPPNIHLPRVSEPTKQNHCTVNLHEHSHEPKFSFFAPHRLSVPKVQTSSITPNSVQVSPPPPSRIMTAYSLTEQETAFVGPTTSPKFWAKTINQPTNEGANVNNYGANRKNVKA